VCNSLINSSKHRTTMSNTKHLPLTQSERMGQFRLKIIGSLR